MADATHAFKNPYNELMKADKYICDFIDRMAKNPDERKLDSQAIINVLRNFLNNLSVLLYGLDNNIPNISSNYNEANSKDLYDYFRKCEFRFLNDFDKMLQSAASHYTVSFENGERLMLKLHEYLCRCKSCLEKRKIFVLHNLDKYPLDLDNKTRDYYNKILDAISTLTKKESKNTGRFYILKKKPIFSGNNVFYEYTTIETQDKSAKTQHIIMYGYYDIPTDYAVYIETYNKPIKDFNFSVNVRIIGNYFISIRPCELANFAKIFNMHIRIQTSYKEYVNLMSYLTFNNINLTDLIDLDDDIYFRVRSEIIGDATTNYFMEVIDLARQYKNSRGNNIIRILLLKMRNVLIKDQFYSRLNGLLSNLRISKYSLPFEYHPYAYHLNNHFVPFNDVVRSIDISGREPEILYRQLYDNVEKNNMLYTSINDLKFENIDYLVAKFNQEVYLRHRPGNEIHKEHNNLFIYKYEESVKRIIDRLISMSKVYDIKYNMFFLNESSKISTEITEEKRIILEHLYEKSQVGILYGSAGTGKTYMITYLSLIYKNCTKLYLAKTNAALENLRARVKTTNCSFLTLDKFITDKEVATEYDIVFVDECSIISNMEFCGFLDKASFKRLLLVGDVHQIESIDFGNWFTLCKNFLKDAVYELTIQYRTESVNLQRL